MEIISAPSFLDLDFMLIEDTPSGFASKTPDLKLSEGSDPDDSKKNHSKDCLTFSRKLSGIVLAQLTSNTHNIYLEIIRLNSNALVSLLRLLDLEEVEAGELDKLQIEVILQTWTRFKDLMTYRKNKKICIVKQEYWDLVFDRTVITEEFQKLFAKIIESSGMSSLAIILKNEAFNSIFSRLLYAANKLMALIAILNDNTQRGLRLRDLETAENFLVLILFPQFFRNYNHRGGKFALECCDKCKICCSKAVPKDFSDLLRDARQQTAQIVTEVKKTVLQFESNYIGSAAILTELAVNYF